jgi:uncharacterized protein (DUF488 family)
MTSQVCTVGHSTRSADEFVELLLQHEIALLVDVRSFPGSRRYPHFSRESLMVSLPAKGIAYRHMPVLGGRRKARADSQNIAWKNEGFRGYADYMETEIFEQGIETLLVDAGERRTVIMCAEALWWRCHRSLISDYLKARGVEVTHILSAGKTEPHRYTAAAQIVEGRLSYRGLLP